MRLGLINDFEDRHFDETKAAGLAFIEICCNNQKEAEEFIAAKDSIKANIARTGIDVSSVGRWNHDIQHDGKIDAERKKAYFAQLDAAMEIGAKTFVCGCNYDDSVSLYKNYTNAIGFLAELIERTKKAGSPIRVALQNCNWNNFLISPEQWKVVLGELPELGIKYDASHCYNRGEDYLAVLSDWGERVFHVHIKGTTHAGSRGVDDPPAGMDDIRWSSLFSILYARKYNGDLSIEPHSATWHGPLAQAGVDFTTRYIKQFILN